MPLLSHGVGQPRLQTRMLFGQGVAEQPVSSQVPVAFVQSSRHGEPWVQAIVHRLELSVQSTVQFDTWLHWISQLTVFEQSTAHVAFWLQRVIQLPESRQFTAHEDVVSQMGEHGWPPQSRLQ